MDFISINILWEYGYQANIYYIGCKEQEFEYTNHFKVFNA